MSDRSMMVQVECLHTVLFPKALDRPTMRCRQVCRPSHILKALGGVLFCHSAQFWYLHRSWFLVVCALHLCGAGWSWPAWDPSFPMSRAADPVNSELTSLHCFGAELGMSSGQLLVSQSASNALSACGAGVGSSIGPTPPTESSHISCSRLGLMGNR